MIISPCAFNWRLADDLVSARQGLGTENLLVPGSDVTTLPLSHGPRRAASVVCLQSDRRFKSRRRFSGGWGMNKIRCCVWLGCRACTLRCNRGAWRPAQGTTTMLAIDGAVADAVSGPAGRRWRINHHHPQSGDPVFLATARAPGNQTPSGGWRHAGGKSARPDAWLAKRNNHSPVDHFDREPVSANAVREC